MGVPAVILWVAIPAAGQTVTARKTSETAATKKWTPSRAPDGQPDLQGVWSDNSATPLERPKELAGRQSLTDEEVAALRLAAARLSASGDPDASFGERAFTAALKSVPGYKPAEGAAGSDGRQPPVIPDTSGWLVERDFDNRTSLIVDPPDGVLPPLTPEAQKRRAGAAAARGRPPAGPEDLPTFSRCITYGVPRLGGATGAGYNSYYQILQTPGYVVLATEMIHEARIVPLDGRPHLDRSVRQWIGDSRGRWEGQTLVVETTNFSPKSNYQGAADKLHLVERFTRVAPGTINYELTLDDPTRWTRPWTAAVRLKQAQDKIYEYACHEGNQMSMHGILAGARADERAAEKAAKEKAEKKDRGDR